MKEQTAFDPMTDRYSFDFKLCTPKNGWAQVDTSQDASYFGTWANPFERKTVSYCEGDTPDGVGQDARGLAKGLGRRRGHAAETAFCRQETLENVAFAAGS